MIEYEDCDACVCGHPYEWHNTYGRCRQRSVAGVRCACDGMDCTCPAFDRDTRS